MNASFWCIAKDISATAAVGCAFIKKWNTTASTVSNMLLTPMYLAQMGANPFKRAQSISAKSKLTSGRPSLATPTIKSGSRAKSAQKRNANSARRAKNVYVKSSCAAFSVEGTSNSPWWLRECIISQISWLVRWIRSAAWVCFFLIVRTAGTSPQNAWKIVYKETKRCWRERTHLE